MNPNDIPDPETLPENTDGYQPSNSLVAGKVDDEIIVDKKSSEQEDSAITDVPVVESDGEEPTDKSGENNAAFEHDDDRFCPADGGDKQVFDSEKKPNILENTTELKRQPDVLSNGHINGEFYLTIGKTH